MNQALHLKYRPQTLSDLVGQVTIGTTLTNAITTQHIAPAYLFTGPRGTGKTSTARILAKSLNCLESDSPTPTPCGQCLSCRGIEKSTSLDVSEIDAASHNGVDDARELIEHSSFAPAQGRYRIFILDECHQLTSASQNALLKVIEEPPSRCVFILCTTEPHKVLPTITSRCQTFNFKALSVGTIVEHLGTVAETEGIEIIIEGLTMIARTVDGGLRDGLQLLSQLSLLGETITPTQVMDVSGGVSPEDLANLLSQICRGDTLGTLQTARRLIDSGKAPKLILSSLLQVYRDLLLVKSVAQCQSLLTSCVGYRELRGIAKQIDFDTLHSAFNQLQRSEGQLRTTPNAATWLEVCLLNLVPAQDNSGQNLQDTWARVIETAKPANRKLLAQAELVQLNDNQVTLAIAPKYLKKFHKYSQTVERIIAKALNQSLSVTLEAKS
jgi:DNA polymerase-3 subunit gamma/tau